MTQYFEERHLFFLPITISCEVNKVLSFKPLLTMSVFDSEAVRFTITKRAVATTAQCTYDTVFCKGGTVIQGCIVGNPCADGIETISSEYCPSFTAHQATRILFCKSVSVELTKLGLQAGEAAAASGEQYLVFPQTSPTHACLIVQRSASQAHEASSSSSMPFWILILQDFLQQRHRLHPGLLPLRTS